MLGYIEPKIFPDTIIWLRYLGRCRQDRGNVVKTLKVKLRLQKVKVALFH